MWCTSALAPTSMPRVGSSRISTCGRVFSHLASMIFCWLPPESCSTGVSSDGVRMRELAPVLVGRRALRRAVQQAEAARRTAAASRSVTLAVIDCGMREAELAPVLREVGDAAPQRLARRADGAPAGRRARSCRASAGAMPNSARPTSVRPAPTRPAKPSTSPRRSSKETSAKTPSRARPATLSSGSPGAVVGAGEELGHVAPDHVPDRAARRDLRPRPRRDPAARRAAPSRGRRSRRPRPGGG